MKNYSEDSSRMAQFLHSFSADRGVDEGRLAVNSLKVRNGMILKVSDAYYEVQFNPEFTTYTITRVYTVSPTDRIHDKADVLP